MNERVEVGGASTSHRPITHEVVAEAETDVEKVSEALIDRLNEIVKKARRILLS